MNGTAERARTAGAFALYLPPLDLIASVTRGAQVLGEYVGGPANGCVPQPLRSTKIVATSSP